MSEEVNHLKMTPQKFESIEIDLSKKIFKLNGELMPEGIHKLSLLFEDGEWSLALTGDKLYSSRIK